MILQRLVSGFSRPISLTGAVVALAFATSPAAAPLVFFGLDNSFIPSPRTNADAARDAFVAALGAGSIATQSFEGLALGVLPASSTGAFANGVGVTLSNTATNTLRVSAGIGPFSTYATSGQQYLEGLTESGTSYFTATFDQALRGIGFYVTDPSDWAGTAPPVGDLKVVLTTTAGTQEFDLTPGIDPTTIVNGGVAFFGIVDETDGILSIAIRNDSGVVPIGEDAIGIDDVMVSVVPAPATLPLLLTLLPVLGVLRRKVLPV